MRKSSSQQKWNCWQSTAISQKQTPAPKKKQNTVILETDEPLVPHQYTAFLQGQLSPKSRVITAKLTKTWITLRDPSIFTSKSHKQKPNSPARSSAFGKHCRKHQELAMHYSILGTNDYFVLLIKGRGGGMLPSPFQECFICGQPYRSITQLCLLATLSLPYAIMHRR